VHEPVPEAAVGAVDADVEQHPFGRHEANHPQRGVEARAATLDAE
jgi:hypothetical protein